ncbi:UDP-N-acetylmuramoyl-L-alanyl-D-glutamate--2,6-diaminopimelate ligase [Rubrivivax rivuli]|uniref:UDP-N-acetylmuramoyl-L-alanyl-D-glutamate--2,6-diaminopimelate ligase n=1 Tax=Rubrivivax rivuli TaxID=1862385 RepID=A0A437RBW0_9BURK|nr:UDP-N-acetylmuramoyl-L-alanyl-D-glutamate--2,6-diaminopimelate ligase [Rubrivivax rivuli]RVU44269.1 UDP-N-acetylmuramoyl-L-alanyl-D-glutamate--2,6-diaminopimelate ligase [Rubrivivax rivuli]
MLTVLTTPQDAAAWLAARVALQGGARLRCDSRAVQPGDAFIAWPGQATDGRKFVAQALAAGAAACLVEAEGVDAFGLNDARIATLPGLKAATGEIADLCMAQPSAVLDVVATTGTNGKTSTAWWTAQALTRLGRRCGVIGTLGVGEPDKVSSTGLTTPDPVTLHQAFRGFVDLGFSACALEASSIGLVEQRLNAARIDVALFTNLTQDHLDYHGSMAAYGEAKRRLFSWPGLRAAVINVDDAWGAQLAAELQQAGTLDVWTVSLQGPARLQALGLHYEPAGLAFTLAEGAAQAEVHTQLVGEFNASNLLVVLGGLRALGVPLAEAAAVAAQLTPVPGRLQRVPAVGGAGVEVVVDYAHTPDALSQVLRALRPLATARGGRLWCVFGCGGNRDATKRPLMGGIAAAAADRVIVTSDNPRFEEPQAIVDQVLAGAADAAHVSALVDRRAAVAQAVAEAGPHDVVLLAGKGHEDYQIVGAEHLPYSDLAEAEAALRARVAVGVAA